MKAFIVLEDGKVFEGKSFGAAGEVSCVVVFSTDMFAYQEILTDSSFAGKAVVMTYPVIGSCGISKENVENKKVSVSGIIVKEAFKYPSNFTSTMALSDYLVKNGTIGIEAIDTREITRYLRNGSKKAVLFAGDETPDFEKLAQKAKLA